MRGSAHVVAAVSAVGPVMVAVPLPHAAGTACLAVAAGLLPDVDHPKRSTARRYLGVLGGPVSRMVRAASRAARGATGTADDRWWWARAHDPDHRGLTHTLAAAVMAAAVVAVVAVPYGWWWAPLAVFAGWCSHLLLDACTVQGVPLWWPMAVTSVVKGRRQYRRWHPVRVARFRSCGPADWWITGVWVLVWAGVLAVNML